MKRWTTYAIMAANLLVVLGFSLMLIIFNQGTYQSHVTTIADSFIKNNLAIASLIPIILSTIIAPIFVIIFWLELLKKVKSFKIKIDSKYFERYRYVVIATLMNILLTNLIAFLMILIPGNTIQSMNLHSLMGYWITGLIISGIYLLFTSAILSWNNLQIALSEIKKQKEIEQAINEDKIAHENHNNKKMFQNEDGTWNYIDDHNNLYVYENDTWIKKGENNNDITKPTSGSFDLK